MIIKKVAKHVFMPFPVEWQIFKVFIFIFGPSARGLCRDAGRGYVIAGRSYDVPNGANQYIQSETPHIC